MVWGSESGGVERVEESVGGAITPRGRAWTFVGAVRGMWGQKCVESVE